MSGDSRRKRRKPSQLDKDVYVNYGMQGRFNVTDLMDDYETVDYNSLPEARAENIDERAAARTLDLLVKYKGRPPAKEWNDAVREREGAEPETAAQQMVFTTDEMELSEDGELSDSSSSGDRLSTKTPQNIKWAQYSLTDLSHMPSFTFCGTLQIDGETQMELEGLVGKRKQYDEWLNYLQKRLKARYRNRVQLSEPASVVLAELNAHFVAFIIGQSGILLNYFHLRAVEYKYDAL